MDSKSPSAESEAKPRLADLGAASGCAAKLVPGAKLAPDDARPQPGEGARRPPKRQPSPTSIVFPGSLTKTPPHHARVAGPHPKTVASEITAFSAGHKLGPRELRVLFGQLGACDDERLLVGAETIDDAAVIRLGDDTAISFTTDFAGPQA
jgi:hypothetical protein